MKVSIITATYNSEKKLSACLDSVAIQTALDSIEHIIVDGLSNDSTLAIASQYPHINQIVSAKDRGIYHAFNRGVQLATGDLIYFLNSDDEFYDSEVVSDVLANMTSEQDFYCGTIFSVNPSTGESYFNTAKIEDPVNFSPPHQAFFCRRNLFKQIGLFNECLNIAADTYFMKKVINSTKGVFSSRPIARFSLLGISSDSNNRKELLSQLAIVDSLLGIETIHSKLPEKLALQTENGSLFKQLLLNVAKDSIDLKYLLSKKIAIFGARELSQFFYHYLVSKQLEAVCFVVSSSENLPVYQNVPVVSLSELEKIQPDIVINCIEGMHEKDVGLRITECCSNIRLISWRDFCANK